MSDSIPLQTPGGFAPVYALGIDGGAGNLARISASQPLPVHTTFPAASAPLEGTMTQSGMAGPFLPASSAPVVCTLSGDFSGTVKLMRSTDDGASMHGLTIAGAPWAEFSGPVCEMVWQETEAGVSLWLDCSLASGTLAYRLAQ